MNIGVLLIRKETHSSYGAFWKETRIYISYTAYAILGSTFKPLFPTLFCLVMPICISAVLQKCNTFKWTTQMGVDYMSPSREYVSLNLPSWANESGQEAWSPKKLAPPLLQLLRVSLFENPAGIGIGNLTVFHSIKAQGASSCLPIKLVTI